jgi:hypothetical protein
MAATQTGAFGRQLIELHCSMLAVQVRWASRPPGLKGMQTAAGPAIIGMLEMECRQSQQRGSVCRKVGGAFM